MHGDGVGQLTEKAEPSFGVSVHPLPWFWIRACRYRCKGSNVCMRLDVYMYMCVSARMCVYYVCTYDVYPYTYVYLHIYRLYAYIRIYAVDTNRVHATVGDLDARSVQPKGNALAQRCRAWQSNRAVAMDTRYLIEPAGAQTCQCT